MINYDKFLLAVFDDCHIDWDLFSKKTVLVTGATGFIGRLLIATFCYAKLNRGIDVSIIAAVRNKQKLLEALTHEEQSVVRIVEVTDNRYSCLADENDKGIFPHFLFHCAAPTRSEFFVKHPIETIDTIVCGTREMLLLAKKVNALKLINLSSMEAFGEISGENITENSLGIIELDSCRSSYPEAKRLAELLCYAFYKENGVRVNSIRLAQCFGAENPLDDDRVFMQFCKAIVEDRDIVLHTDGTSTMNYVFPSDAIRAIIYVALYANSGETYTVVGDAGSFTIRSAAEWMLDTFGSGSSRLVFDGVGVDNYPKNSKKILSNEKICSLGWQPYYSLKDGFSELFHKVLSFIED